MENRSAIWIFTGLLVAACLYQLSFNLVTKNFEDSAAEYCMSPEDSLTTAAECERSYLQEHRLDTIYPVLGHTYQHCKEQQLNLGLDLQGGMSATLEVDVPELVKNLSDDSSVPEFVKALEDAKKAQAQSNADFMTLFEEQWAINKPTTGKDRLPRIFKNLYFKDKFKDDKTDAAIIETLKEEAESAIKSTEKIVRQRIDREGVAQPNIQRQAGTGRILLDLAGIKDPERIKKLIGRTANLEFWPIYENTDKVTGDKLLFQYFEQLDSVVAKYRDPSAYTESLNIIDTIEVLDPATQAIKQTINGQDSVKIDTTFNQEVFKRRYPLSFYGSGFNLRVNQRSNAILTVREQDKDIVQRILDAKDGKGEKFADKIIPNNVKLMWDAKGNVLENGTVLYGLYALKDDSRRGKAELDGSTIVDASQNFDQYGKIVVNMQMNSDGAATWAKMTKEASEGRGDAQRSQRAIAITLDNFVYSAPTTNSEITGGGSEITMGGDDDYFGQLQEAKDLSNLLEAGSLPAPAKIVNSDVVGPSLGEKNIQAGKWSFIIALLVIMAYMIFYYSRAGVVSDIALVLNIFLLIGGLAAIGATLTLPGIAGLVLTLGMAVDANVLIYERIREEMRGGKGLKQALTDGYSKAYSAILDANITTLLTAIVLYTFGSGPVKGFATTLIIGIFTSLFSAIVITRLLFWHRLDKKKEISFASSTTKNWFTKVNYQFVPNRKKFYTISGILVAACLAIIITMDFNYSVEFKGGSKHKIAFDGQIDPVNAENALKPNFESNSVIVTSLGINGNEIVFTTDHTVEDTEDNTDSTSELIKKSLDSLGMGYEVTDSTSVDPSVSDEFRRDSLYAAVIALIIIFLYIFFRFRKWQYGLGALFAMIHDVIIVLGLYTIGAKFLPFTMEIDQAFIAAILTVIGYSINDTVVVFDRIREYLGLYKKQNEKEVINKALNSTLSRTINTSLSTLVVLIAIFALGSDSIRGFIFALIVGVVVGTYSSIFIATPSVIDLDSSKR